MFPRRGDAPVEAAEHGRLGALDAAELGKGQEARRAVRLPRGRLPRAGLGRRGERIFGGGASRTGGRDDARPLFLRVQIGLLGRRRRAGLGRRRGGARSRGRPQGARPLRTRDVAPLDRCQPTKNENAFRVSLFPPTRTPFSRACHSVVGVFLILNSSRRLSPLCRRPSPRAREKKKNRTNKHTDKG